ncbi:MAG: hypothetical protein HC836_37300 [Richelia sp. RM2_1_2]|nr:hypothetical protein [Richelia sp. RM2_1_2]
MSKKQNDIEAYLKLPIVVGDKVLVKGESSKNPDWQDTVEVVKVDKTKIYFENMVIQIYNPA